MARIVGLDYGMKRCGLATTDPLQIIVNGLDTVETQQLLDFFKKYLEQERVEKLVIGLPVHKDGNYTYLKKDIDLFVEKFALLYPDILIDFADEQFSSVRAREIIMQSGIQKNKRRDKSLIDKVSAVVILQKYLHHI